MARRAFRHDRSNAASRLAAFDQTPEVAPPTNIWFGVSAGVDPPAIFDIPAKVHFLSCEPMLRAMDESSARRFNWIIFGGESDPKGRARECKQGWIKYGLEFCRANSISAFVKQLGAFSTFLSDSGMIEYRAKLRDSHGGDTLEWPDDLRVREFPTNILTETAGG